MTGYTYWYIVIVGAYYPFVVRPICKNYLFSSVQHRWGYVGFIMIVIEIVIFLNVMVRVEIYCTCTAVLVFTLTTNNSSEILVTDFLTIA